MKIHFVNTPRGDKKLILIEQMVFASLLAWILLSHFSFNWHKRIISFCWSKSGFSGYFQSQFTPTLNMPSDVFANFSVINWSSDLVKLRKSCMQRLHTGKFVEQGEKTKKIYDAGGWGVEGAGRNFICVNEKAKFFSLYYFVIFWTYPWCAPTAGVSGRNHFLVALSVSTSNFLQRHLLYQIGPAVR